MEVSEKDLPQLIVGLDSLDDSANYIHISHAKENTSYYCPCCKGLIKPRAYKNESSYQVQPHFYHESGGCKEETYVHYICKNWLFGSGCKFIVGGCVYTVESIEVEKTLSTSFGDYRPDIIVTTTAGKVFYFEIKVTNRKSELYAPKWDKLENDVVEVDTRYFINQKFNSIIPEFDLIYSDGECFIKSYTKKDYDNLIAKRKLEWKRQDVINYKIKWERLDWFWNILSNYSSQNVTENDVIESFRQLDHSDKVWFYGTVRKKRCVLLKDKFKDIINQELFYAVESLSNEYGFNIEMRHKTPMTYDLVCSAKFQYLDYSMYENDYLRFRTCNGGLLPSTFKEDADKFLSEFAIKRDRGKDILNNVRHATSLPFVREILPASHWGTRNYPLSSLKFIVSFKEYAMEELIEIDEIQVMSYSITEEYITKKYEEAKERAIINYKKKQMSDMLKNNAKYLAVIEKLKSECSTSDNSMKIYVSDDYTKINLLSGGKEVYLYVFSGDLQARDFEEDVENIFMSHIDRLRKKHEYVKSHVERINNCKNQLWRAEQIHGHCISLSLYDNGTMIDNKIIDLYHSINMENDILIGMNDLFDHAQNYKGIRYLEEN